MSNSRRFLSRLVLVAAAAVAPVGLLFSSTASAENLHQKYGPSWDCSYISVGQPYYPVCKSCEARGMEFFRQGNSGYCVPKAGARQAAPTPQYTSPRYSPPRTPPSAHRRWGAIAAGIDEGRPSRVGTGISWNYGSKSEAEAAALRRCGESVSSCRIVDTFNVGCGYVTTGRNSRGQVGWGAGSSAQAAYNNCTSRGLQCNTPSGGCIN